MKLVFQDKIIQEFIAHERNCLKTASNSDAFVKDLFRQLRNKARDEVDELDLPLRLMKVRLHYFNP